MTKYELRITGECKQNLKLCKKRGLPMQELLLVVMTMSVQTASADVEINKTNFPDDIFRNMSFTMRTIRM